MLVDAAADPFGEVEAQRAAAAELIGHRTQGVVGAGEPRGVGEALVEGDRVGRVLAVDRGLALDDGPRRERRLALHVLEAEVEDDVPERVVRALGVDVAARDPDLVREQALVFVVVGRYDHEPVTQRRDRSRILIGEALLDQDGRLPDVRPVDLVVVDAAERGDQVAERLSLVREAGIRRSGFPPRDPRLRRGRSLKAPAVAVAAAAIHSAVEVGSTASAASSGTSSVQTAMRRRLAGP